MNKENKISIVVPVYNVERYINRCVESILAQTYNKYELILVDDGSPDNCPQICDELADSNERIHVIHQQNGGLSAARNSGIEWALKNSESKWITFIDSDDWVHPTYLEDLLYAATSLNCRVSMCQLRDSDKEEILNISEENRMPQRWDTEDVQEERALNPNSSCGRLFDKELFQDIRFPVGKLHEDRFTTYKLLFQFDSVAVVYAPLYYYYVNPEGIVRGEWNLRKLDNLEATEQQIEFFSNNGWERTYIYIVKDYIHLLVHSLRNMKGVAEYRRDATIVRKKLRHVLKEHKVVLGLSFDKDFNTYKYAYPTIARIYRRLKKS